MTKPGQIEDPRNPCEDAVSRKHSHFFTPDGEFGSLDAAGDQVDDGPYSLRGKDTLVVGGVTFSTGSQTTTPSASHLGSRHAAPTAGRRPGA